MATSRGSAPLDSLLQGRPVHLTPRLRDTPRACERIESRVVDATFAKVYEVVSGGGRLGGGVRLRHATR
jgi:hypothetical protein